MPARHQPLAAHVAVTWGRPSAMSESSEPSGFYGAPLTKALSALSVTLSIACISLQKQSAVQMRWLALTANHEWWRLLMTNLVFTGNYETILGAMLLYTFRVIERQLGSRKFGAFIVLVMTVSTWFHVGLLVVVKGGMFPTHNTVDEAIMAPGPFATIYALLAFFHAVIPKKMPCMFSLLGLHFSDKSMAYLLAFQLLGCEGWRSILPSVVGYTLGKVYLAEVVPLHKLRLPRFLDSLCSSLYPLVATTSPPGAAQRRRRRLRRQEERMQMGAGFGGAGQGGGEQLLPGANGWAAGGGGDGGGGFAGMPTPPPPPEGAVTSLTSMGFSRAQALEALAATDNNVEAAANRLLT